MAKKKKKKIKVKCSCLLEEKCVKDYQISRSFKVLVTSISVGVEAWAL